MFFELREYRTMPGQRENWVKFMEEEMQKNKKLTKEKNKNNSI